MEKEDIRVGGKYLLPVTVTTIEKSGWLEVETINDYSYRLAPSEVKTILSREASAFPHINPYPPLNIPIMTEIPETYPKYDPCRKFRKGDKAKPRIINGREPQNLPLDVIFTVIKDEYEYGHVQVSYISPTQGLTTYTTVHAVWLELVHPAEELEPYSVGGSIDGCILYKNGEHYAEFVNSIDAERACKLLNAECRKEQ